MQRQSATKTSHKISITKSINRGTGLGNKPNTLRKPVTLSTLKARFSKKSRLMCVRLGKGTHEQQEMAQQASNCTWKKPCEQDWCPQCILKAQKHIGAVIGPDLQNLLRKLQSKAKKSGKRIPEAWTISGADERLAAKPGKLDARPVEQASARVLKSIDGSRLSGAIWFMGIDVSFNVEKGTASVWQPQLYGIVFAPSMKAVRKVLKRHFPRPDRKWAKPLKISRLPIADIPHAAEYVLKPNYVRRERYVGPNGRKQTRKWDLKAGEEVEAATFLQQLGFHNRLLLRNVKMVSGNLVESPTPGRSRLSDLSS